MKIVRYTLFVCCLAAGPALAGDLSVSQKNQVFTPGAMTVHVGDTVRFVNDDSVTHNVTVKNSQDDADDLGLQKPGGAVSYHFDTKGSYRVICSIHPRMKMTVNVQ